MILLAFKLLIAQCENNEELAAIIKVLEIHRKVIPNFLAYDENVFDYDLLLEEAETKYRRLNK